MNPTLFSNFPKISPEDWKATIEKDLKGLPFDKVITQTEDGFSFYPFYTETPNVPEGLFRKERAWKITQDLSNCRQIAEALVLAKQAIASGADSLFFSSYSHGGLSTGLPLVSGKELDSFVSQLPELSGNVLFALGSRAPEFWETSQLLKEGNQKVSVDFDPIGTALLCGEMGIPESDWRGILGKLSSGSHICIHTNHLREAGSTVVQELAYGLAWFVEYLEALLDKGVSLQEIPSKVWFWMGTGTDYFQEIAKIRAFRWLLQQVLEAYGAETPLPFRIHASNLQWNQTVYDPYVNILRGTTTTMSAAIGGADSISCLSFDSVLPFSEGMGERISRNLQLLMRYESYLDKVEDPSSGSYFIETLTYELSHQAWTEFQSVAKNGGFWRSVKSGYVQAKVSEKSEQKRQNVRSKKLVLLGTNQYANTKDHFPSLDKVIEKEKKIRSFSESTSVPRLQPWRASEEIEGLRLYTDLYFQKHNKLPKVCLLPVGDKTMRKARASFGGNFLANLGYEIVDPTGFSSSEEAVLWAKDLQPEVVVLCSSDEEYDSLVPDFCKFAKTHLPQAIRILAGYPKDKIEGYAELGIQEFIHLKRDLVEFMHRMQTHLKLLS